VISRACLKARRASRDAVRALRADPCYLGDEAWHFGQPPKANPFSEGTEENADWRRGWDDSEFDALAKREAGR